MAKKRKKIKIEFSASPRLVMTRNAHKNRTENHPSPVDSGRYDGILKLPYLTQGSRESILIRKVQQVSQMQHLLNGCYQ